MVDQECYLVCKHYDSVKKINVTQSSQHCVSFLCHVGSTLAVHLRIGFIGE